MFSRKETTTFAFLCVMLSVASVGTTADNAWRTVEIFRQTRTDLDQFQSHPQKDAALEEISRLESWLSEGKAHLAAQRLAEARAIAERLVLQVACVRAALENAALVVEIEQQKIAVARAKQLLEEKKAHLARLKNPPPAPTEVAP